MAETDVDDPYHQLGKLSAELASIHHVHIEDVRALIQQHDAERTDWEARLEQSIQRECGSLCKDIEEDRDALTEEVNQLREQGVPGVMHEADRIRYQVMVADRDRFAELYRTLCERQRRLVGEYRAARYAVGVVGRLETLLGDALGTPGKINRDNLLRALAELVKERDELWAAAVEMAPLRQETDVRVLQDTIDTQKRTIDTQVEDIAALNRVVNSQQGAIQNQHKELQAATERYRAAEGQVRRLTDEATRREVNTKNAHDLLLQQGIDLDVFRERAEQAEQELEDACEVIERQRGDLELLLGRNEEIEQVAVEAERRLREEGVRYAGLQITSQAVGGQLTRAIGLADRARRRRVADTELLHTAHGIIANAEDNKLTLPCLDAHCVEGDHIRDMDNPQPIGDPEWKKAAGRWFAEFHAREAAAGAVPNPTEDPLSEFTVRPVTNGQFQWVYVEHAAGGPYCDLTYPRSLPGDVALLSQIVHDAHLHVMQHHGPQTSEGVDEAPPDDAEDPCDAICHPEHGACCGKVRETPTEVDE